MPEMQIRILLGMLWAVGRARDAMVQLQPLRREKQSRCARCSGQITRCLGTLPSREYYFEVRGGPTVIDTVLLRCLGSDQYYNRYANHEQSARLDKEMYTKTEKKMEEMQQNSELSWIEVQFLKRAVEVVVQCRNTMKWTYAFAYYLQRNNATELFEDNQRDLEMAVEQLSELLEKPIEADKIAELRQQVLDKSVYCASRREVVLEDTAKGLLGEFCRLGFVCCLRRLLLEIALTATLSSADGRWLYQSELVNQKSTSMVVA